MRNYGVDQGIYSSWKLIATTFTAKIRLPKEGFGLKIYGFNKLFFNILPDSLV